MSNRQARREQSRTSRKARPTRAPRQSTGAKGPSRGGGGPGLFSLPYLLGLGGVVVLLLVVLIVFMTRGGGGDADLVTKLNDAHVALPAELAQGTTLGKADAPLKLDEYEDFQCPFCLKYTAEQEGQLIEEYVKTGKLQITYKQYPVNGAESVRAAVAGQCAADQNRFWDYHSKLFLVQAEANQVTSEKTNVGRFSDDKLKNYAKDLGLDSAKFDQCLSSDTALKAVNDQVGAGKALGVRGTPSFVINGQPLGTGAPGSIEEWRKVLDDAYKIATASPSPAATGSPAATTSPAAAGTPAASPTK